MPQENQVESLTCPTCKYSSEKSVAGFVDPLEGLRCPKCNATATRKEMLGRKLDIGDLVLQTRQVSRALQVEASNRRTLGWLLLAACVPGILFWLLQAIVDTASRVEGSGLQNLPRTSFVMAVIAFYCLTARQPEA